MTTADSVPTRAWVVTGAGTTVNLCLGILYAWSVWKANLIAKSAELVGTPMTGVNEGWVYLSDAQATWAYAICGFLFALMMIPGGRLQDRYGPRMGAMIAGVSLSAGCILAGLMKSYLGLVIGFGVLGGIGMGFGYAAATPAAVKWFGPHRRGLIVGLVVGGYGGAAIYISPLASYLIGEYGLTGSLVGLGVLFGVVVIGAGLLLIRPPAGYTPPAAPQSNTPRPTISTTDWAAKDMLKTWQFYGLMFLFIGSAQSGLLVIANAAPILKTTASNVPFFADNAWLLASFGGILNASGRIGTGSYSDRIGRVNAYTLNGILSAICLLITPYAVSDKNVLLLFIVVGVVVWQYGGALCLMPAMTADYYGAKNLGLNYGLVFLGWGIAFFIPQLAAVLRDATGREDLPFYLSGSLLLAAVILSRFLRRPQA